MARISTRPSGARSIIIPESRCGHCAFLWCVKIPSGQTIDFLELSWSCSFPLTTLFSPIWATHQLVQLEIISLVRYSQFHSWVRCYLDIPLKRKRRRRDRIKQAALAPTCLEIRGNRISDCSKQMRILSCYSSCYAVLGCRASHTTNLR